MKLLLTLPAMILLCGCAENGDRQVKPEVNAPVAASDPLGSIPQGKDREPLALKAIAICVRSLDDLPALMRMYRDQDEMAGRGLLARGKAIRLDAGTSVRRVLRKDNIVTSIEVLSGINSGEDCWMWNHFLE